MCDTINFGAMNLIHNPYYFQKFVYFAEFPNRSYAKVTN